MEKALALTIIGLVLSALLMSASIVVACYATSKVGYRTLKEVVTGVTSLFQEIWVCPDPYHCYYGGFKEIQVPWEYPVYETVMVQRVAGGGIFWVLAAIFAGLTMLFTILLADELGVLGIQKTLTIVAVLIGIGAGELLLVGYLINALLLICLAAAFLPPLVLLLIMGLINYISPEK